jgi:ATP-binding cassette subfamily B protein
MNNLRSDRTSFVIAHRLSTIRDADVILVMENGAIVENGSHAQLLALHGRYYALYNSQFLGAIEDNSAVGAVPNAGQNRMAAGSRIPGVDARILPKVAL